MSKSSVFVSRKTEEYIKTVLELVPDSPIEEQINKLKAKAEEIADAMAEKGATLESRRTSRDGRSAVLPDAIQVDYTNTWKDKDGNNHRTPTLNIKHGDITITLKAREDLAKDISFSKIDVTDFSKKNENGGFVTYTAENIPESLASAYGILSTFVTEGGKGRNIVNDIKYKIETEGIPKDCVKITNKEGKEVSDTYVIIQEPTDKDKEKYGEDVKSHLLIGSKKKNFDDERVELYVTKDDEIMLKATMLEYDDNDQPVLLTDKEGNLIQKVDYNTKQAVVDNFGNPVYVQRTISMYLNNTEDIGMLNNDDIRAAMLYVAEHYAIRQPKDQNREGAARLWEIRNELAKVIADAKDQVPNNEGKIVNNVWARIEEDKYGNILRVGSHEGDRVEIFQKEDGSIDGNVIIFSEGRNGKTTAERFSLLEGNTEKIGIPYLANFIKDTFANDGKGKDQPIKD